MSQENVQLIHSLYEAFARGDVAAVLSALDPNMVWHEAENFIYADLNPYIGPDNILNGLFLRLGAEWEGFRVVPEEFIGSGDTVVVTGRYHGTYRATGKTIHAQMVHVWKVAAGKAKHFQQYVDTAQVRDAVS